LTGEPTKVASTLSGRLWRKLLSRTELDAWRAEQGDRWPVLRTRRVAGRIAIHVYAERAPDSTFAAIEPDLEDAYFWAIKSQAPAQVAALDPAAPAAALPPPA
jgi:ABC-2 type transport system ATP-binding protein